jgi:hypothetical protein
MRMLLVAVAVLAGSVVAAPAAESPLLGVVSGLLVRTDPHTLERLPGAAIGLGDGGCAPRGGGEACWTVPPWSFSPDRRRVALALNDRLDARSLRLVDVARMRVSAEIPLRGGAIGALAWLAPRRILAVQEDSGMQSLLVVDLDRRRVVARKALGDSVETLARSPRALLLLLAPAGAIGPARLVVADARGALRSVRLGRILAGLKLLSGEPHSVDHRAPGLAVDPRGRRAYVAGPGLVAEVDLARLSVRYHALAGLREPAARSKTATGYVRRAQWLGGRLAVSGSDSEAPRIRPAGLALVDTRTWHVRSVDRAASDFVVAGNLLLATGSSWGASVSGPATSIGLVGYGLDGNRRFALFEGSVVGVIEVAGGRAFVYVTGQEPLQVVDLARGQSIGSRRGPLPRLLDADASSWWD